MSRYRRRIPSPRTEVHICFGAPLCPRPPLCGRQPKVVPPSAPEGKSICFRSYSRCRDGATICLPVLENTSADGASAAGAIALCLSCALFLVFFLQLLKLHHDALMGTKFVDFKSVHQCGAHDAIFTLACAGAGIAARPLDEVMQLQMNNVE
jgi:hypothetical protein